MRSCCLSFIMVVGVVAAMGCESPCNPGFQRYGNECVRSPDAGSGEDERDSGRQDATGDDTSGDADAATTCMRNACGGCSGIVDAENLGMPCEVGKGDCEKAGAWVCDGKDALRCSAVPGEPGKEACGGGDEDCDGKVDESPADDSAREAKTWYADCDGDGFALTTAVMRVRCELPSPEDTECGTEAATWTRRSPTVAPDCADLDARAFPGQTEFFATPVSQPEAGFDFDCSGGATPSFDFPMIVRGTDEGCKSRALDWIILTASDDSGSCYDYQTGYAALCGTTQFTAEQGFTASVIGRAKCAEAKTLCAYAYAVLIKCK